MSREDKNNYKFDNLINSTDIFGVSTALLQFTEAYKLLGTKRSADFVHNPLIMETQKIFSKYDEILKPLHMELFRKNREVLGSQISWMKNNDFAGYKSLIGNMNSVTGVKLNNVSGAVRALKEIVSPLQTAREFSNLSGITASISGLSSILQGVGSLSLVSEIIKDNSAFTTLLQKKFKYINVDLLGEVTDQVLAESEDWTVDAASEAIALKYEKEKARENPLNNREQSNQVIEKHKIDAKEVREWLNTIINIIMLIITLSSNSPATTIYNYNYTQQVNNYYIVGMGYDAETLNAVNYRIVNCECVVRLKHDCHSQVIGKLEEGQIIRILDKYKKWRQIVWEDENGGENIGWIQNYKLTEFKRPKKVKILVPKRIKDMKHKEVP